MGFVALEGETSLAPTDSVLARILWTIHRIDPRELNHSTKL